MTTHPAIAIPQDLARELTHCEPGEEIDELTATTPEQDEQAEGGR